MHHASYHDGKGEKNSRSGLLLVLMRATNIQIELEHFCAVPSGAKKNQASGVEQFKRWTMIATV